MNFDRMKAFQERLVNWRIPGNDCMIVKDGEEYTPATPVSVSIRLLDTPDDLPEGATVNVVHFGDEPTPVDCAQNGEQFVHCHGGETAHRPEFNCRQFLFRIGGDFQRHQCRVSGGGYDHARQNVSPRRGGSCGADKQQNTEQGKNSSKKCTAHQNCHAAGGEQNRASGTACRPGGNAGQIR